MDQMNLHRYLSPIQLPTNVYSPPTLASGWRGGRPVGTLRAQRAALEGGDARGRRRCHLLAPLPNVRVAQKVLERAGSIWNKLRPSRAPAARVAVGGAAALNPPPCAGRRSLSQHFTHCRTRAHRYTSHSAALVASGLCSGTLERAIPRHPDTVARVHRRLGKGRLGRVDEQAAGESVPTLLGLFPLALWPAAAMLDNSP